MGTLKGQNFRVCIYDTTLSKYKVIAMATNCTVTLTNNTDESNHKDVIGMAAMPVTVSKSWQVSVDSLDVSDTAAMLTAIKAMNPFTLMWDETSTSNNQTREKAAFCRKGDAYLSDCTFTFNDRENSTKALQFSGSGAIQSVGSSEAVQLQASHSLTKGQFVRLFLSSDGVASPTSVIAAAKQLQMHVSLTLESSTTKDTDGDYDIQEPTALSYDITTNALIRSGETITSQVGGKDLSDLETIYENGTPVAWKICNVSGANNRTAGSLIVAGSALIKTLKIQGPNRQNATYEAQLQGHGDYFFSV